MAKKKSSISTEEANKILRKIQGLPDDYQSEFGKRLAKGYALISIGGYQSSEQAAKAQAHEEKQKSQPPQSDQPQPE